MKSFYTFLFIVIYTASNAQDCNCDSIFYSVKNTVEKNYAGYFDKVNSQTQIEYEVWTKNSIEKLSTIKSDSLCYAETKKWLTFYKDKHIQLKFISPKKTTTAIVKTSKTIEILQLNISEIEFEKYLKSNAKKDKVEGIWENSNYKLAVKKMQPNLFYATVLESKNSNWKAGEVKMVIEKKDSSYNGTFYAGDKDDTSNHPVKVVDNILDFDIIFFENKNSASKVVRNIVEYEIQQDKQAPKLNFINSDLAVFSFPNFYGNSYEQLEFLLKHNKDKLEKTPYWIIDLQDNDGGDYSVGKQLLPYLYTKPIVDYNSKMRITKSNIQLWFDTYLQEYYNNLTKEKQEALNLELKNLLQNHNNEIYDDKPASSILKFDSQMSFPKKVGIVINKNTLSSGELFTMLARQSDKVSVYGENSTGMMDYGNLVTYKTPCKVINLRIPINRQNWLDEGFSVDKEGIKPDVYIDKTTKNWIDYVYSQLKK
ncbi:S41 family peptidase [Flavobacterium aquatile]|uniref:Tail specific protease domain-containing protein n=1 Tax=Flavobacterium aquatile LMG 4008 = ATCC 11947 TaxID=1453498 RepID=A0A095SYM7_9FLAO|nr:S41 family peptidase [Flavobacterium aquatile]KGD69637.1 hypothetical protein LG45_02460 [Flavobacterium aquatile LMG 4008 = ATCC 11947]OXA67223.1 hypothetical protein B0A61_08425 [Flavobacterium aquatile LMG 4008 = ATCC 11947]GEC77880.1 hypothetical protein FAQ01_07500 [Flavobacterium aquatile]